MGTIVMLSNDCWLIVYQKNDICFFHLKLGESAHTYVPSCRYLPGKTPGGWNEEGVEDEFDLLGYARTPHYGYGQPLFQALVSVCPKYGEMFHTVLLHSISIILGGGQRMLHSIFATLHELVFGHTLQRKILQLLCDKFPRGYWSVEMRWRLCLWC